MQDRDSKHKAEITQDFINERLDMIMMTWPKGSSDLNPIENIWSWLKRAVPSDLRQTNQNSLMTWWIAL